jgi:hypothetical protein
LFPEYPAHPHEYFRISTIQETSRCFAYFQVFSINLGTVYFVIDISLPVEKIAGLAAIFFVDQPCSNWL